MRSMSPDLPLGIKDYEMVKFSLYTLYTYDQGSKGCVSSKKDVDLENKIKKLKEKEGEKEKSIRVCFVRP